MSAEGRRETAVVGGGIVGLAVAFELARRGRDVTLFERERPGAGATDAAGGMLAPISEAEFGETELIDFARESLRLYPDFVREVERLSGSGCGYRGEGTLWVATNRDDREEIERLEAILRDKGLDVEPLDAAALLRLEPHLTGRVLGGLRAGADHQVDPRRLARALADALRALGGRLEAPARVEAIRAHDGTACELRVRRPDGSSYAWRADEIVLAAGAWSLRDIELPAPAPELRPVKGQLVRLRGEPLLRHVVRTPDVYLVPREDGELLVGATMEETGFDESATAGAVMDLLRHAWEVLPASYDLSFAEVSVGLRPAFDDHLPAIGPSETDGLWLALGHFRHGVLLAPATAAALAAWIVEGERPAQLAPFDPRRGYAGRPAGVS